MKISTIIGCMKNLILRRPLLAIFDVTKYCNQACPMCNVRKTISEQLSLEEIQERAGKLKKIGIRYVFIQGGEPTLRNDLIDIVDVFIMHGIKPTIITNGVRLDPEIFRKIAQRNCNLSISIDTLDREKYEKLRGKDNLNQVLQNIRNAPDYQYRKGNWSITATVTKLSQIQDLEEIERFATDHHFMFAVRPYIATKGVAGKYDSRIAYKKEEILDVFYLYYKKAQRTNYLASLIYAEHIRYLKNYPMRDCDALKYSVLMCEDGHIAPCIEFPDLTVQIDDIRRCKKQYLHTLRQCNKETPCFYNDAREIGTLYRNKWKILLHSPQIIVQLKKYHNFF